MLWDAGRNPRRRTPLWDYGLSGGGVSAVYVRPALAKLTKAAQRRQNTREK